jgi:hypothetical protein
MRGIMNTGQAKMSHFQAKLEYLEAAVEEQKAIIRQLIEGPGNIMYIHPVDLGELLNSLDPKNVIDVHFSTDSADITIGGDIFGRTYRQSVFIPAKSKNFKAHSWDESSSGE